MSKERHTRGVNGLRHGGRSVKKLVKITRKRVRGLFRRRVLPGRVYGRPGFLQGWVLREETPVGTLLVVTVTRNISGHKIEEVNHCHNRGILIRVRKDVGKGRQFGEKVQLINLRVTVPLS